MFNIFKKKKHKNQKVKAVGDYINSNPKILKIKESVINAEINLLWEELDKQSKLIKAISDYLLIPKVKKINHPVSDKSKKIRLPTKAKKVAKQVE